MGRRIEVATLFAVAVGLIAPVACGPPPPAVAGDQLVPSTEGGSAPTEPPRADEPTSREPRALDQLPIMALHEVHDNELHVLGLEVSDPRGATLLASGKWFAQLEGTVLTWKPCLSKGFGIAGVTEGWGRWPEDAYVGFSSIDGTRHVARWDRMGRVWRHPSMPEQSPRAGYWRAHAPDHGLVQLELSRTVAGDQAGAFVLLEKGSALKVTALSQRFRKDACMAKATSVYDVALLGDRLTVLCARGIEWWKGVTPASDFVPLPLDEGAYRIVTSGPQPLLVPTFDGRVLARLESGRWIRETVPGTGGMRLVEERADGGMTFVERDAGTLWVRSSDATWLSEEVPFDPHAFATAADGARLALTGQTIWHAPPSGTWTEHRFPDAVDIRELIRVRDVVLLRSTTAAWSRSPITVKGKFSGEEWFVHPEKAPPCLR